LKKLHRYLVQFFGGSCNSFHLIYHTLQLVEAIAELQSQGYNIPNYNPNPTTEEETDAKYKAFLFFFFLLFTKKSSGKTVCENTHRLPICTNREMENISRDPILGRCRTTRLQEYRVQDKRLPSPPLLDVMYCVKASLHEDRGSGAISINLCVQERRNKLLRLPGYVLEEGLGLAQQISSSLDSYGLCPHCQALG
jgi:hypothetical protein